MQAVIQIRIHGQLQGFRHTTYGFFHIFLALVDAVCQPADGTLNAVNDSLNDVPSPVPGIGSQFLDISTAASNPF